MGGKGLKGGHFREGKRFAGPMSKCSHTPVSDGLASNFEELVSITADDLFMSL